MNSGIVSIAFAPAARIQVSPLAWAWQVTAIVSMLVFTSFSALDLGFSALFFDGTKFSAAEWVPFEIVRQVIWRGAVLLALACLVGAAVGQLGYQLLWISPRRWTFSTILLLIGPVLIVNEGLKKLWGRARSADVVEFGGSYIFTPALVPTDQCARNCSFVSGEGSGAVALAIVVWALTEDLTRTRLRMWLRMIAIVLAFVGSVLRIVTGRHFLSDTVFAALIVTGLALLLRPILPKAR